MSGEHGNKHLMMYAHFNKLGLVSEHVFFTLEKFAQAEIEVVFISSSSIAQKTDHDRLQPLVKKIILVPNIGYDFYQWKCGIESSELNMLDYDKLMLLNSSVIGPVLDLKSFIARLDAVGTDVTGVTSSLEGVYHLQSYCLYFSKRVFTHHYFTRYWRKLRPIPDRDQVILNYELRQTRYFSERNFSVGALCEANDDKNPTLFHPEKLLSLGVPFIKIQLLNENPEKLALEKFIDDLKSIYPPLLQF